jgi:hypothetical protein
MIPAEIPELAGKAIQKIEVYSDAVLIELSDGKTAVAAFVEAEDENLRVEVRSRGPEGAPPGVRVYLGRFPCPHPLPEYARRR